MQYEPKKTLDWEIELFNRILCDNTFKKQNGKNEKIGSWKEKEFINLKELSVEVGDSKKLFHMLGKIGTLQKKIIEQIMELSVEYSIGAKFVVMHPEEKNQHRSLTKR